MAITPQDPTLFDMIFRSLHERLANRHHSSDPELGKQVH